MELNYEELSEKISKTFDILDWNWEGYGHPTQEDIATVLKELNSRMESAGADVIELGRLAIRRGDNGEANTVYVNFGDIGEG